MNNVLLFYCCCKEQYKVAFKKHIFVILKFWRQEVQKQVLSCNKVRMWVEMCLLDALGRTFLDLSFSTGYLPIPFFQNHIILMFDSIIFLSSFKPPFPYLKKKTLCEPGVVMHTFSPSTQEAEVHGSL